MNSAALEARLAILAARRETITYGVLAKELAIPGPGSIAKLTAELETLMKVDFALGHPIRAVLVIGRLNEGLPALGFFDTFSKLCSDHVENPTAWIAREREKLYEIFGAQKCN